MKTIGFALMMDVSGSMGDAITQVKINTKAFVDKMMTNDQFCVNCFNDNAHWVYPTGSAPSIVTITGYDRDTPEKKAARTAIEGVQVGGNTNIGDAISLGFPLLKQANTDKKAFILLSDGEHNTGTHPKDVLTNEYPIYIAGLGYWLQESYFEELRKKHPDSRYYHRPNVADLEQILNDIRGQAPDTNILTNQKNTYEGNYYQETESFVCTDTGYAQFTVVWNDKRYKYTNGDAGGYKLKVYLVDPKGKRYTSEPTIVGEGYCIFNLTDARPGRWRTFVEYSVPQITFATNGSFEFGASTRLTIHAANIADAGSMLAYEAELTDNGIPVEGVQVQARILQPVLSAANARPSYDPQRENLPTENILDYRQSNHQLAFTREGTYKGLLSDTHETGFHTIEITASGTNPLTGRKIRLTRSHTVLIT